MQFQFVAFNYKSSDLEAEERNYLGHHVALARKFPGLRQYHTGRLLEHRGRRPDHFRAALLAFDNAESAAKAMTAVPPALIEDTQAHLKDLRSIMFEGEVIVPFQERRPGQSCFLMVAEFNLENSRGLEAAEHRYRNNHTALARRLPELRNYIIGRLADPADRYRIVILAFDSEQAFLNAYRSDAGTVLRKDEDETIRDARVHRLEARVEL